MTDINHDGALDDAAFAGLFAALRAEGNQPAPAPSPQLAQLLGIPVAAAASVAVLTPSLAGNLKRLGLGAAVVAAIAGGVTGVMLATGALSLGSTSGCLLYTSPSPRDGLLSRMPSSA